MVQDPAVRFVPQDDQPIRADEMTEPRDASRRSLFVLLAVFSFFACLQILWLSIDRRPIVEERDFFIAARMSHDLTGSEIGRAYPDMQGFVRHSPLAPTWAALFLAVFGCRADIAVLSLLPFIWLLMWSVYRVSRSFCSEAAATACAVLVLCFHHFAVVEPLYPSYVFLSEFEISLPLSALVAATCWRLLAAFRDPSRKNVVILGLIMAAGMLTRIIYPVYVLILVAALWSEGFHDSRLWKCFARALPVGILLAAPWYLVHLDQILRYMLTRELSAGWALYTGMPDVFTLKNLTCYLDAAVDMLSWPFLALAIIGMSIKLWRKSPGRSFILSGLGLAYVILTLHWGKSIRFMAPCLLFLGLAAVQVVDLSGTPARRRFVAGILIVAACLRMVCMHGFCPGYRDVSGISADELRPSRDDWRVPDIMKDILAEHDNETLLRMTVVPFLGHFRHASFMQYAYEKGIRVEPDSGWRIRTDAWRDELGGSEFIITRIPEERDDPYSPHQQDCALWIRDHLGDTLHEVRRYDLLDGTMAVLYRNDRKEDGWVRLEGPTTTNALATFNDSIVLSSLKQRVEGGTLVVQCEWKCLREPGREYRFFVQLRRKGRSVVDSSFVPGRGLLPITNWKPGFCLAETYRIPLSRGAGLGDLEIWAGWYRGLWRLKAKSAAFPVFLRAVHIGDTGVLSTNSAAGN
jgi:hypothetical protein